jgi:hypothetical protein
MSDVEVGRIYAEVGADISDFLAGMDIAKHVMEETAGVMAGSLDVVDAAFAAAGHEAGSFGRNVAEGAIEAAAAMTGAAGDVLVDAEVMATAFDHAGDAATEMADTTIRSALEEVVASTVAAASAVVSSGAEVVAAMVDEAASFATQAASSAASAAATIAQAAATVVLVAAIAALVAELAVAATAAAIFGTAMAGIFALGALGTVFKQGKNGSLELVGAWKKVGTSIFDTLHSISQAVTKPLFSFLLAQLKDLDKWVHTASFKKDMQALGKAMLEVGHDAIIAVKWIHDNWGSIQAVLLKSLNIAKLIGEGFAWLAKEAAKYWPMIKHAAEVTYQWFMTNLWPGLKQAFHAIVLDVTNLAHGFRQAWPQISQALSSGWAVMKPLLALLVAELGAVQTALAWLTKNSGPAISALASAISGTLSGVASIINGVASALSAVVSALHDAQSLAGSVLGFGGGNVSASTTGGGRYGHTYGHAAGGIITGPLLATGGNLFGEAGREAVVPLDGAQGRKAMQQLGGGGRQSWGGGRARGHQIMVTLSDTELDRLMRATGRRTARTA